MVVKKKGKGKSDVNFLFSESIKKGIEDDIKAVKKEVKKAMKKDKETVKKIVKKKLKMKSGKDFNCFYCGNIVNELDHQVSLTTSNNGKIMEDVLFHVECWSEYFRTQIKKRTMESMEIAQKFVAHKIQGIMQGYGE